MSIITLGDRTISGATGGRRIDGDDPLVILVHGAGMDRTVWSLQTRWLAHHGVCALAIDLPGHGASPEEPCSDIDRYAEWLAQLVARIDRPVHLVGHSMGSYVVLETAARTDLGSLILVGTAATMPVHPALLDAAEANDPLAARLMSGWAFAPASRTGPHPSPGSSMAGGAQALIGQARAGVLHSDLAMCAAYDQAIATAGTVTTPTTFLLGGADRMTPVAKAQALIDAMPQARVDVVDGVGHMIMIEAPAITRSTIVETVHNAATS